MPIRHPDDALNDANVIEAMRRGIIRVADHRIKYSLQREKEYAWADPEEWVRASTIAWLVVDRDYPANRMMTEVQVPRRIPSDFADIVVYRDDACREPYLVVENKEDGQSDAARRQWIEQLFGNANSLRAPLGLYDDGQTSLFYDVGGHPPAEREANRLGDRNALPKLYGAVPVYPHIAGAAGDISPAPPNVLEARIRRAHAIIWSGGKRDPLVAFDEWSKMLFAKVIDERTTPTNEPRRFQVGTNETTAAVANRVHRLFNEACRDDPSIFPPESRITLPDNKITEVVRTLQSISFWGTNIDSVGHAFEHFFGSIFRGELGQYFTMRQLARFTVGMLNVEPEDYVLDPTAGSGGFLLEALLQTWHAIDRDFAGQPARNIDRLKTDFAQQHVYGVEIHETLARICKINLLLHHDGHTNIEGSRSVLDSEFSNPRLNPPRERFSCIVGNPPFGDQVKAGDEDKLGGSQLTDFVVAQGRRSVDSEQVILERCVNLLEPGGRLGLVMPDGLLNNQGELSNCPATRRFLARSGRIEAIVSLPDYAFRKSGAQNKTSILFFRKFSTAEARRVEREVTRLKADGSEESDAIVQSIRESGFNYRVFLAEANYVGYNPAGHATDGNDLFRPAADDGLGADQAGSILGEWRAFRTDPAGYAGRVQPDCMAIDFSDLWTAHVSHRLDPKYHLFKREALRPAPEGWVRAPIGGVMRLRADQVIPETEPDRAFTVMTIGQTGEIRPREAGKGKNPPEWLGAYFALMPSRWYGARTGDVVYSSIDLWKGCIAVVPRAFDGALVTKEFPIFEVIDERLNPRFLQALLRSRYYQRAFRAITTGHSNRRRTQRSDFEALEVVFPPTRQEQDRLIAGITEARDQQRVAVDALKRQMSAFSNLIDGRGDEELPEVDAEIAEPNGDEDDA